MKYIILVCAALAAAFYFTARHFYNFVLRRSKKDFINKQLDFSKLTADKESNRGWFVKSGGETAAIKAFDGIELKAYVVKNNSRKWLIFQHGYGAHKGTSLKYGRKFYENGFNVVMPDLRGHGESGGDFIGMGWVDRKDILSWISYILSIDTNAEIVLMGVSMGAVSVLCSLGETLPPNVKCAVSDSAFTSFYEQSKYQFPRVFGKRAPAGFLILLLSIYSKFKAKYSVYEASAIKMVKKAKIPVMFIHGGADSFVPVSMVKELFNAAATDKELLIVEGANHIEAAEVGGDTYWKRVFEFVSKYTS